MDANHEPGSMYKPIKNDGKSAYSTVSLILSLVPIVFLLAGFLLLMIAAGNDIFAGTWSLFIVLMILFAVVAILSTALSVIFGIMGLVKSNGKTLFSWAGMIVVSLEVLID